MEFFLFYSMHVMQCALRIGFLDDGNRLHGGTLLDIIFRFYGADKSSCFCNYNVEPHLPASCGASTFRGRMRLRAKTSFREQVQDFNIVGTYEWLSYVRASESQAYGVLVRFSPCRVYIN
jgi:hypothetical protein